MTHRSARGLAVSAVSALALTGLAVAATPAAHAAAPEVRLISQATGIASLRLDSDVDLGGAASARLTARVDDPAATVTFQANLDPEAAATDPGWLELSASVAQVGPYATATWNGSTSDGRYLGGERVALRVSATNADGTSYSVRPSVEVSDAPPAEAVRVATTSVGYFTQPYAGSQRTATVIPVSGTTSATSGTVALSTWRDATGQFTGRTTAQVEQTSFKTAPGSPASTPGGEFTAALDITGFDAAAGTVAVSAVRDSDDVTPVALTPQTLQSVGVNGYDTVRPGESTEVELYVIGSDNAPVVGAEVRRLSDGGLVGYTDLRGEVVAQQLGGSSETYYANATDADGYAVDQGDVASSEVVVETYTPSPSYTETVLVDGPVFDRDELARGDVAVVAVDERGRAVGAGVEVAYALVRQGDPVPSTFATGTTDARGRVPVPVPTDAAGAYVVLSRLASQPAGTESSRSFVTGQAALVLSPKADPVVGAAGGQVDYVGRLAVEGEALPGRRIDLSYRRGVELVPGTTADAGIVTADGLALSSRVTTNANGTFRVTVDDVAENPQAPEVGGVLTAATGTNVATDDSELTGNAGARDTSTTRFGTAGPGSVRLVLTGTSKGGAADVLTATGPTSVAGERVKVFRVEKNGKRVLVTTRRLNASGDLPRTSVKDRNGTALTTYVVQVVASQRVRTSLSNTVKVR